MDIGIQSNVWGPDVHRDEMPRLIAEIAQAGYGGIEIGAHRFKVLESPEIFLGMVKKEGLRVSGIHTLVKFYEDGDIDYAKRAADFTKAVESQFMLVSGEAREAKTEDDYKATAEILNKVGEFCKVNGIQYVYHNHWFEIENQQKELRALCELTDPNLVSLCLDIGWVERAKASIVDVTTEFLERIRYFHLKDTADEKFVDLGNGTVNFPAWLDVIRGKGDFYLTHERDEVMPDALESATHSREYLWTLGL